MIGHRVYGPLMRLEIKVNPIPHVGSGRNVPPYQEIVCLLDFFPFLTHSIIVQLGLGLS